MPTSLLYHAFGTRGSQDVRTQYIEGRVIFTPRHELVAGRCPACGAGDLVSRGCAARRFRSRPIGSRGTSLALPIPRVECRACGAVRQVDVTSADPRRGYTEAVERYVPGLSRRMTIRDVATHPNVGWDPVKDIRERDPARRHAKPEPKHLRRVAIGEIAVAKGHRYLTPALGLEGGAVVSVGDGAGADAPKPSRKRRRPRGAKIEAVAMEMSAAYRGAASTHLKGAVIVSDHLHVTKPFDEELSDLRRSLYHRARADREEVLKGARWLLLKGPEDLDADTDEKGRREGAPALNKPLAAAYYPKEDLRRFRGQPGGRSATASLNGRLRRAEASGVKVLQQMAETRAAHRRGLLAYYDARITSGPMEGADGTIKAMKRMASGSRDPAFLERKIVAIHETEYALVG
jgi:transposase